MGEMVILRTHISILWQAQDEMWGTRFCGGQTGATRRPTTPPMTMKLSWMGHPGKAKVQH